MGIRLLSMRVLSCAFYLDALQQGEKIITEQPPLRQPPMRGKYDSDSEISWISDGLPAAAEGPSGGAGEAMERESSRTEDL